LISLLFYENCRLFTFPTVKRDAEARRRWLTAINRADPRKTYALLEPGKSARVCSVHFVDSCPTAAHPDPELQLGASKDAKEQKVRVGHKIRAGAVPSTSVDLQEDHDQDGQSAGQDSSQYCTVDVAMVLSLTLLLVLVYARTLWVKCCALKQENCKLRAQLAAIQKKSCMSSLLKTDSDVKFYTGIENKSTFTALHDFLSSFVRRRWRGAKYMYSAIRRKFRRSPQKFGPNSKLTSSQEFLLTLMKLRLGLLNRDLAARFGVSSALCSKIVHTWLHTMYKILQNLVLWPSKEQIIATKPSRYRNLPDLRAIIDCSEVFIETPKDPFLQCATYSDYKHHNTLKFLIAVAPNSAITFISKCYAGRASDKAVTVHSKFLDKLDMHDMIQADKGFNIRDECAARLVTLHIPPGKRGAVQLSTSAVSKTKRIANLRILVEQVIRRLKTFRILQTEIPITLVPNVDEIVTVCAALCNLKRPIYTK